MDEENVPVPVPSVVWLPVAIGVCEVLQHTPLAVTSAPPWTVTFPPPVAVVELILLTAAVVTVGGSEMVTVTAVRVALGQPVLVVVWVPSA